MLGELVADESLVAETRTVGSGVAFLAVGEVDVAVTALQITVSNYQLIN